MPSPSQIEHAVHAVRGSAICWNSPGAQGCTVTIKEAAGTCETTADVSLVKAWQPDRDVLTS